MNSICPAATKSRNRLKIIAAETSAKSRIGGSEDIDPHRKTVMASRLFDLIDKTCEFRISREHAFTPEPISPGHRRFGAHVLPHTSLNAGR